MQVITPYIPFEFGIDFKAQMIIFDPCNLNVIQRYNLGTLMESIFKIETVE